MKINLNSNDLKKLDRLLQQKYDNIASSELYNSFLFDKYALISKSDINELTSKSSMNINDAYFTALLLKLDILPSNSDILDLISSNRINKVSKLDENEYLDNPYLNFIHPQEKRYGKYSLQYNYYQPFEGFIYDEIYTDKARYFAEYNRLGFFTTTFNYLTVLEDDRVWMSITPHEINTMKKAIDEAKGKVVAYGLGLGYFPFMCSLKEDVTSIDIIEKDKDVIDLFEAEILPQFRFKGKINIINADAFDYAKNVAPNKKYDFSFFDIYHDEVDGLPLYLKMKELEKLSIDTIHSYWIEESILSYLRRFILTLIEESLNDEITSDDYKKASNEEEQILNDLYFKYKDFSFNSYEEIDSFLKNL